MKEEQFTKARPFTIPENGPAVTNAEKLISSIRPEDEARRTMQSLRR